MPTHPMPLPAGDDSRAAAADVAAVVAIPRRVVIVAIVAFGLAARLATFQSPLFDFHSWRQADTAAISRNFVEERFNPLYPQIDHRGSRSEGYVQTGLELHAFIVATMARAVGFSTHLGRLLSASTFPLTAILLYLFIARRYDVRCGLVGLFLYAFAFPLSLFFDRAFMNEALLALFCVVCLRATQMYLDGRGARWLLLLLIASTLIGVVKPTFLVIWGAVFGLFVERFGWRALYRWEVVVALGVTAIAGLAWFNHAAALHRLTGLSFGITDKLFDESLLFSFGYLKKVSVRLFKDVLGPVPLVFGAYGLVVAHRMHRKAEIFGVAAFLLYLGLATIGNYHHNYYQLPVVPIATVAAAVGCAEAVRRVSTGRRWSAIQTARAFAIVLGLAAASTLVRSISFHSWYEINERGARLCHDLGPRLRPADRVAFVHYQSPDILFCLDRKGWLLAAAESTPERLDEVRRAGAAVIVFPEGTEGLAEPLKPTSQLLAATGEFTAYRVSDSTRDR